MCEAMDKLGCPPNFLTVIGDDFHGIQLKSSIPKRCTHLLKVIQNKGTANCTIVFDKKGNCKMLLGDMTIHKEISTQMILDHEKFIKKSSLVVVDANLTIEALNTILKLADRNNIPVLYEPTDAAVAIKPFKSTNYKSIKIMTPNLNELKEIATFLNISYNNLSTLEDIAELLKEVVKHVDNVILTLGSRGVLIARKALASEPFLNKNTDKRIYVRQYSTTEIKKLVNVSGAGDCFASGFIAAVISNKSEEICVSVGFAAAKLALLTESAVPESMFDNFHESWNMPAKYKLIQ